MCPFEEWLGFCPFAALNRLWRFVMARSTVASRVPVEWVTRR